MKEPTYQAMATDRKEVCNLSWQPLTHKWLSGQTNNFEQTSLSDL